MDSETLIDYVWPLQTDGVETAGEGHEQLTPGGEWDEPLVGAEILDFWSPQSLDDYPICPNEEPEGAVQPDFNHKAKDVIEISDGIAPPGLLAVESLVPIYNGLKELKDEVANQLLDSLIDGSDAIDAFEDIDLDEFFEEINQSNNSQPRGRNVIQQKAVIQPQPIRCSAGAQHEAENAIQQQPCLPSPTPSSDSGVSSATSSFNGNAPFVQVSQYAALVSISAIEGSDEPAIGTEGSYLTIDPRPLDLTHCDLFGAQVIATGPEVKGECASSSADSRRSYDYSTSVSSMKIEEATATFEMGESDDTDATLSGLDSSAPAWSEEDEDEDMEEKPLLSSIASPTSIDQFHSYAQSPVNTGKSAKNVDGKGRGRGRRSAATVELKKTKKKEQNKTAAQRYRMKKKMESGCVFKEEQEELKRNRELKTNVEKLEWEIQYLKNLLAQVKKGGKESGDA